MKHLIIGNGIAGINAAKTIREMDNKSEIIMVSDEIFPPYSRPMISHVLDGSQPHENLPLFSGDIYEDLKISPVLGQRVADFDTKNRSVQLEDGTRIDFDRLLIASGADARKIKARGTELKNIFYMRTESHLRQQLKAISKGVKQALVLGGGLVGFKAAYGLLKKGIPVTMLITSGYPLAMQVDETAGLMIMEELQNHGLQVKVGVSVIDFDGDKQVRQAILNTGERLDCDMVIAGKGVLPSLDFISRDYMDMDLGILVDDCLESSVPGIYAAGDVAESFDIVRRVRWINAIWPEAAAQGRIAGYNMAGRRVQYPGSMSRNVMRVYGLDVMTLGLANPGESQGFQKVEAGGAAQGYYRSLVFKDVAVEDRETLAIAGDLADAMMEDYGMRQKSITLAGRAPAKRRAVWGKVGITPRGIDRETSEMMHRTHMGVDNNWQSLLVQGLRNALSDGWGGSMIATEVSDILFGVPAPKPTTVNAGVLKKDQVNIAVHGHNPVVSEMLSKACMSQEMLDLAKSKGASGINLAGVCCTGNELLMRRGIAMAGNHLMTELILSTGAIEMMIVDYQCIMPSLGKVAATYHTKMISTSDKAQFPEMEHHEFHPDNAEEKAVTLVKMAIENYGSRKEVYIPVESQEAIGGFSIETIIGALGGTADPLIDAIKAGKIRGAVGIVGCNNPKIKHDYAHVTLTRKLIENDVLVVDTGCVSVATAKAGFKVPSAIEMAGPGLKEICGALGIPPVLHLGSCVDNVRILVLVSALANALGVDISDLPVAGSAPEWYSEKAIAIGTYCVASGITTHLGLMPPITGSMNVIGLLTEGLKDVVGAAFAVEPDPEKAAVFLMQHIESKRKALGLDSRNIS